MAPLAASTHTATATDIDYTARPPPLDVALDDPSTSSLVDDESLRSCPPLQWGILGCGRVSHDFCLALRRHVPTASIVACATSSTTNHDRGAAFGELHNIGTVHTSYSDLANDPHVQIVYVGIIHVNRREIGSLCLQAGKHVLMEKPLACTVEDATFLIQLARERNLFLQEGMWTRFFPAVEQARRLVVDQQQRLLGEVATVTTDFNFNAADSEVYPDSFVYQRKLGGGASLLVGPYPIASVLLFFGSRRPARMLVTGQVDRPTGVDLQAAMAWEFAPTGTTDSIDPDSSNFRYGDKAQGMTPKLPGAGVATLSYGMMCESEEITTVVGTRGRLTIESPCHCPTRLTIHIKAKGRGNAAQTIHCDYALPLVTESLLAQYPGTYHYPNSSGFAYEAAAVARCIAKGLLCCPQYTLAESAIAQYAMQEARVQLNVKDTNQD